MEENNARREPTSFRDILDEEERRKCYFSKSLSPSSFSPCSSTVWKKLPSEEPVRSSIFCRFLLTIVDR